VFVFDDDGLSKRKSRVAEAELDITPMIDVTFLLLIFFMVATTVSAAAQLQLPHSDTGRADEMKGRVVLVVDFPHGIADEAAQNFSGSQFIDLGDAKMHFLERPDDIISVDRLDATLRAEFSKSPNAQFVLQASRKMPYAVVREVLKAAGSAGAKETLVAVSMQR